MTILGPVAEATHGARSSPLFDLFVGTALLIMAWIDHFRKEPRRAAVLWTSLGMSAISAVFLYLGIVGLIR
jgi:hypothetical protein